MPREASAEPSPNGSTKTVASAPLRRNADCPNHSTCMLLLQLLRGMNAAGGRLVGVVVAATAHERGGGGNEAGDDREREGSVEPVPERRRDQLREEGLAGQDRVVVGAQRRKRVRPQE